eukprot:TRINITY_DN5101_c0_g1_i3.p1 TRINITY_DN5101_c0_g1~~TRINITY_DN5101_c0_g1_i3.p1  ORF type:complete len:397 (-),score=109.95 TRINITY_DN5101_c0_g1_i3:1028-2218(-)
MGNRSSLSRGSNDNNDEASSSSSGSLYSAAAPSGVAAANHGKGVAKPLHRHSGSGSAGGAIPRPAGPVPMWNASAHAAETNNDGDDGVVGDDNSAVASLILSELKREDGSVPITEKVEVVVDESKKRGKKIKSKRINQYALGKTIGKGSFGKVKLVTDTSKKQQFAMKIMSKGLLKRKKVFLRGRMSNQFENVKQELKILYQMKHPNIIALVEIIDDKDIDKLFIVMEHAEQGAVMSGNLNNTPLGVEKSRKYFVDLMKGLAYLHSKKILHRDIKPENLLIDSYGNLKIADFGISMEYEGREDSVRQHAGTAAFMAPEMCSSDILEFSISGIDVWSAGITLWMFIFGTVPFIGINVPDTYDKILNSRYPSRSIDIFWKVISQLLICCDVVCQFLKT